MAGLTTAGFTRKTLQELTEDLEAELLAAFPALNTKAGVAHQLVSIFGAKLSEAWELAEAVYAAYAPSSASGDALDRVSALTGTTRRPATRSTVTATVNLDAGVTLPAGSIVRVAGDTTARFVTLAAVTNTSGSAASVPVEMEAESAGPVAANAGTLTVIVTPVAGWNSVTNALDAELGQLAETDAELRARRAAELRAVGGSTVDAIRADLLQVEGVLEVAIFENTGLTTDGNGVPGKAFEAVVRGGTNAAVAAALWASKPAGVRAHGLTSVTVEDSRGEEHTVRFSRPSEVEVYLEIDVTVDADVYPADGDDLVAAAVAELGDATLNVGDDVVLSALYCAVFSVAGVLDVTAVRAGTSSSPTGTANLTIAARELALLDTSRIEVSS